MSKKEGGRGLANFEDSVHQCKDSMTTSKKSKRKRLITAANNIIAKIDIMQQNSKFFSVKDETINNIISKCNKLAQKRKTKLKCMHDWV